MIQFNGGVLILGYGYVARCALPILLKHIDVEMEKITIIDFEEQQGLLERWIRQGLRFIRRRIKPDNMNAILTEHLKPGGLLIDLAWNIDCGDILQWCRDNGVLYVNTSVELWDPYANAELEHPTKRTLYWRHINLHGRTFDWSDKGPTAVIEHGANPGLISHWTKQGLVDIAQKLLSDGKVDGTLKEQIQQNLSSHEFELLAMNLEVKVIHISERDTQVSCRPKEINEFVNTWSIEGFREEGVAPAELGWGTHERWLPPTACQHSEGPRNQICLARMGINVQVRSWVPDYPIIGMIIRHGEAFTISKRLTVWRNGVPVYRPTVHYAYCPCDAALASLHELRAHDCVLQSRHRIMTSEINKGDDILGALIMGHRYTSWWTGSRLSIDRARSLINEPNINATTMQVAIGVVAAAMWAIQNPEEGVCVPDDLPHEFILEIARPYLGDNISQPSDWTPLRDYKHWFGAHSAPDLNPKDPWQFKNFLITESK